MSLTVQARFTDTRGNGVGRWRNYYRPEDMAEAKWCAKHLAPTAQIRVMDGRTVIITPRRVSEFLA
jgi:hypothetical protein